jgi:hypothetical protein
VTKRNKNPTSAASNKKTQIKKKIQEARNHETLCLEPQHTMKQYIHTLLDDDYPTVERKPLNDMGRTHVKKVKYRVAMTVSSNNGNLFAALPPQLLAACASGSTASPFYLSNSTEYTPSSSSNNITTTSNFDIGIVGTSGTDIALNKFWEVYVENCHVGVTLSGVSNLDKKGKLYMCEARRSNWGYGISTTVDLTTTAMNELTLADIIKLKHYKEVEIMNMGPEFAHEYHYIPERGYSNEQHVTPTDKSSAANDYGDMKGLVLIVSGAAVTTQVIFDITIGLRLRPKTVYYNTYPSAYSNCFLNPDPVLRYLEQDEDCVIAIGKKHEHRAALASSNAMSQLIAQYRGIN